MRDSDEEHVSSPKLAKKINKLRKPAEKTKKVLIDKLKKTIERFGKESKEEQNQKKKDVLLKRLHKETANLKVLKELKTDAVIEYALSTNKNLMAIAANKRLPNDIRMKARVASHKPLSNHLHRLKRAQQNGSDESDGSEEDEKEESDTDEKSSKLNKANFCKEIVLLRSHTKRSVIYAIHKISKNIKRLRESKVEGEKKAVFEAKVDRLVKKIKYIKECEADEISKFALSNTMDIQKILSDSKMPLKTQAMATVTLIPILQKKIKAFRDKFPDWEKTVPTLLKQKKKKKRKLVLPSSSTDFKGKQLSSDIENSESEDEVEEEDEENSSDDSAEKDESSDPENEVESSDDSHKNQNESLVEEFQKPFQEEIRSETIKKPRKDAKITETKTKSKHKSAKEEPITDHKNPSSKKESVKIPQPKVVDPFFVTTTNEEYVTSQIPKSIEINSNQKKFSNDSLPFREKSFSKTQDGNKWKDRGGSRKRDNFNDWGKRPFKKPFNDSFDKNTTGERRPLGHLGNRKERRKALHQPPPEVKTEKLHPSWEAKKKVTSIASFQGKKITFD